MSAVIIASFADLRAFRDAAAALARERFRVVDAFTPVPADIAAGEDEDGRSAPRVGWAAAIAGLAVAGLVYGVEAFSAGVAYPFNSGSRPLNSWPVFLLAPFELGVLAAAMAGFVAFLLLTGLPRLNHPAFDIEGIGSATQDRFLLAVAAPRTDERKDALAAILKAAETHEAQL